MPCCGLYSVTHTLSRAETQDTPTVLNVVTTILRAGVEGVYTCDESWPLCWLGDGRLRRQVGRWKGLFSNDTNDMHVPYTWRNTRIDITGRLYSRYTPFIHQQSQLCTEMGGEARKDCRSTCNSRHSRVIQACFHRIPGRDRAWCCRERSVKGAKHCLV
jgi:hypothetical protein